MRFFFVSVASVASFRQKVGKASDALPKDGSNLKQDGTKKKKQKVGKSRLETSQTLLSVADSWSDADGVSFDSLNKNQF
jgi:hypothetical protein